MSNAAKVDEFLDKAEVFYFLTVEGDAPKGRPFSFHLLEGDKVYFGVGTFKPTYAQLQANSHVEILASAGSEFLRYDGKAKFVDGTDLMPKVREAMPQIMALYDKNGWELGLFYLEEAHAEIHTMMGTKEEFDV